MKLPVATLVALIACPLFATEAAAQTNTGVGAVLGDSAVPGEPFPEIAAIEAQLDELVSRPDAQIAETLTQDARRALQRARSLASLGHTEAAERAKLIAWAAWAAASHTIALQQATLERAAVQRRKARAETAAAAARLALDHARAQAASIEAPLQ